MNARDYAAGWIALLLTLGPWPFAGYRVSRRLLPDWVGAARALVAAVIAVSALVIVAEALGVIGQLGRWQMALASAVVAVVLWWVAGLGGAAAELDTGRADGGPDDTGPAADPTESAAGRRTRLASLALAGFCVLGVSAALLGRDAHVLHTGPSDADSLHYHLSDAAYFAQSGSIDHIHQTAYSDASAYYPLDDELLDAVMMFGPHPDIATFGINLGFAWLALLACWVIGARWRMAAATIAAGSSVLAIPLVAGASSGPGLNDIPATAAFLAAIAIAVHAEDRPRRWLTAGSVAGLAAGLAAGGKLSLLGPTVLVGVVIAAGAPVRRLAAAGVIALGAIVTGGFWYVRDWLAVGSPVPEVDLTIAGHGLHAVPTPLVTPHALTVAHYLGNWPVIRHWFVPALKVVATPLWPVVLGIPLLGILLTLFSRGERLRRGLALAAAAGVVLYLFTPTSALGPPGMPVLFGANVRYVIPVIALGTVLFATARPFRRLDLPLTAAFTVLSFGLLMSSSTGAVIDRPAGWAAAVLIAALVAWGYAVLRWSPSGALTVAVAVAVVLAIANAGAHLQRHYLRDRYTAPGPRNRLVAVTAGLDHQRIGVAGFPFEYPFYGDRLGNRVDFIGRSAPNHSFGPPSTCNTWRRELARGHYDFAVINSQADLNIKALAAWTASIPGSRVLVTSLAGTVIRLPTHIGRCPTDQSPSS